MTRWREARVSSDGTHHTHAGGPLYVARFDEVLKFHAPGLAPVRRGGEAWHVHEDGGSAYARRFRRTFGFYEGRAAVVGDDGWHHIFADGRDLAAGRYAWCGNFQGERCPVRDRAGAYHHIDDEGRAVYAPRWRYAGDYRDGIAVVQGEDGRSTHIDHEGRLLHDRWYLDLDVFHKGLARARDEAGWLHVDHTGCGAYARRFAAVEPFYNGQARVERHDGGLEIVEESARCILELRGPLGRSASG